MLASAYVLAALVAAAAPQTRYLVVVGNNAAPPEAPQMNALRYADDDALRYFDLLARGAAQADLLTVLDSETAARHPRVAAAPPSLKDLRERLDRLNVQMTADRARGLQPELTFIFVGHGSETPSGEPILALMDESLTRKTLFELLSASSADRIHLIVDACNAGAVVGVRGPFQNANDAEVVALSKEEKEALGLRRPLEKLPRVGALIATSAGQSAHEWSEIQAGVFSHTVVSGLLGAADVNGDLKVEYSEIHAFVTAAHRRVPDPRARPNVYARPPAVARGAALVDLQTLPNLRWLRGSPEQNTRISVTRDNGVRYLDAHVAAGHPFVFALPAQESLYLQSRGNEARVEAAATPVAFNDLSFRRPRLAARGRLDDAYQKALFAEPFGRTYYTGFVDSKGYQSVDLSVAPLHLQARAWTGREITAVSLWGSAGAAAVASAVTAGLSVKAKNDFNATNIQAEAARLADRERAMRPAAIGLAVGAVVSGAVGLIVWPWSSDDDT